MDLKKHVGSWVISQFLLHKPVSQLRSYVK